MNFELKRGVWPTMVTPFDDQGKIDWMGLESLVEWYISKGVDGVFAVCQSSEMFYLTLEERVLLAKFVVEKVNNRCGVIASGHISDCFEDQILEINSMADTGAEAIVLVANRIAAESQDEIIWIRNMEKTLKKIIPEIPLGLYECPYPYKRILTDYELEWVAQSGRFYFLKDTSSDFLLQKKRVEICKHSPLKLYNANSATLYSSLMEGYRGFCGVMGNFPPELYSILVNYIGINKLAAELSSFLGFSSILEYQAYPVNAKYYLSLEGLPVNLYTRNKSVRTLSPSMKKEVEQFWDFSKLIIEKYVKERR